MAFMSVQLNQPEQVNAEGSNTATGMIAGLMVGTPNAATFATIVELYPHPVGQEQLILPLGDDPAAGGGGA
jgi:hypothetical protein